MIYPLPLKLALALLLSALLSVAQAAGDERRLRSAGKFKADTAVELSDLRSSAEIVTLDAVKQAENYSASTLAARDAGIANRYDQLFEVYSADVDLLADIDRDGFHHALRVTFDADVDHDSAMVYAKLFLSREGEPWGHYFTTDLFQIHGDSRADTYEVESELLDGYYPGYYAVLIEIYSLDHAYMVASEVLDYHYLGKDLPIESLDWDERSYGYYGEVEVHAAAGMGALPLLLFLLIQVVIALRAALAASPLILRPRLLPLEVKNSPEGAGREQKMLP